MAARKKIEAIIEASSTGFGVYCPSLVGITGYGKTVEEAKADLMSALVETVKSYGKTVPKELQGTFDFVYKYDIASIFNYFGMLDATNLAKRIGINPSLLRQYKSGITTASDKQKQKIEHGLHQLGRELLSIRL
jgi:predicted RNase H-like HicB family nuclease